MTRRVSPRGRKIGRRVETARFSGFHALPQRAEDAGEFSYIAADEGAARKLCAA